MGCRVARLTVEAPFMRIVLPVLLTLLTACDPASAVLLDGDALDDTADPDVGSDDTGRDGTEVDPDSEIEPDTEPDTEPPPLTWTGTRTFTFDEFDGTCVDVLEESGIDVTDDPEFADARAACPVCNHIFLVTMDKEFLCPRPNFQGYGVATPTLRGIGAPGGDPVTAYFARLDNAGEWGEFPEVDGSWSNFEYSYQSVARVQGFQIPFVVEAEGSVR